MPVKKRKMSAKDHVGEAVGLLKVTVLRDPTKGLLSLMRDGANKARKHELEMTKLLLSATAPASHHPETRNEMHSANGVNYLSQTSNFQHHQQSFQVPPFLTQGFTSPTPTYS